MTVTVRAGASGFATAAQALLRKHGIVPVGDGVKALTMIPSGTLTLGEDPPSPCFVDGAADPRALAPLGIKAEGRSAEHLVLRSTSRGTLGPLAYTRWQLRPKDRAGTSGTPYALEPSAPWRTVIDYQAFAANGGWMPVLYAAPPGGDEEIVAVSDGARLVVGVPLLDVLGSLMAWPEFDDGYNRLDSPTVPPAVGNWLIATLREHALAGSSTWAEIETWPDGAHWALTIRHDYDRLLTDSELRALLDVYARLGVRSTWYLLRNRTIGRQARLLAACGHEVALHTTARNGEEFHAEAEALRIETGLPVCGVTAHGGAIGYLGDRHIEWAIASGLSHGETIGRVSTLPFLAQRPRPDGVDPTNLILLATHRSLDRSVDPEAHNLPRIIDIEQRIAKSGGHVVLMNHPDLHRPQLLEALARAPLANAWCCTAAEVAAWTRAAKYGTSWQKNVGEDALTLQLASPSPWPIRATIETAGEQQRRVVVAPGETSSSPL